MLTDREQLRLLILEDVPFDAELVERALRDAGLEFVTRRVETEPDFLAALGDFKPDLVLSDYSLPSFTGLAALRLVQQRLPSVPVIIVTGSLNEETAVECIKAGAADYVLKDRLARLPAAIHGALERRRLAEDKRRAEEALRESEERYHLIFDKSPDAVLLTAPDGRIFAANPAACRMFGLEERAICQVGRSGVIDSTDPRLAPALEVRARTGSFSGELTGLRSDGVKFPIELTSSLFEDRAGNLRTAMIIRDISERRLIEETLRQNTQFVDTILENAPIGFAVNTIDDGAGRFVSANFEEIYHVPRGSITSVDDYFEKVFRDPVFRAAIRERIMADMASGDAGRMHWEDIPIVTEAGEHRYVTAINIPLFEQNLMISTVQDVTEHRRAEEALRLRDSALAAAANAIVITDSDGRIEWANPAFTWLTGYDLDEARGQNSRFLKSGAQDGAFYEELWRTIKSGAVWHGEIVNRRRDDTVYFEEMTITPVREASGAITHFIAVKQDITERKRGEAAVAASEQKYRQLFEAADDAIMIFEPDGELILEVNRRACEMYGFCRDELIGMSLKTLTQDVPQGKDHLCELSQAGVARNFESVHLRRDGNGFPVLINSARIDLAGRKAVLSLVRDITERKELEEQLRHAQKMEAVGQLAGGVAHDFNNLLQAMLSLTQMLVAHLSDPERLKTDAVELEQQVRRGAALTRQLLLFSRRETVRPERLDLNDVIRENDRFIRRLLKENIAIEARLANAKLPVDADRSQLGQVLLNLSVNAADAMPDGGRLAIETGSDGLTVWVKVTDTGGGIPVAIRDHVFEPFFTTKGQGKGTGLGLSVVHGIVTQHGGTVTFESREGQGTTFAVALPRAGSGESPAVKFAERGGASPRGLGERVLVVEDEESARRALAEMLTVLGYAVTAVGSGEEAGRLPPAPLFDLMLTDLMLPGISGSELAIGLQARWPDLRVVLMSGYTEDDAVRHGVQAKAMRFLQKPFDMEALARELRAALDAGRSEAP